MTNKEYYTHIFLQEFQSAYKAATTTPAPTGNAKVIAKWPTQQKSTLTVIQYQQKTANYLLW